MQVTRNKSNLPQGVTRTIGRLRRLVRWYVVTEGAAGLVIVLGVAFWIGLALDWSFEPNATSRLMMWAATLGVAAWTFVQLVGRRLFARLSDESLALAVEEKYPEFNESLITAVEVGRRAETDRVDAELLSRTSTQADEATSHVEVSRILSWRPLGAKLGAATLLAASIVLFSVWHRDAYGFWLQRMQLVPDAWPRRVELHVDGFEEVDGALAASVAQGDEFDIVALASIVNGHEAPDEVEVRWRMVHDRSVS
ncbi:MAG: hypothetical protein KDA61_13525, partial [Planctomycetales bacterium]|nr:hypothetical protein [Planctomycetales bacterium]